MDTQDLLIILISVLSALWIMALIVVIVVGVMVYRIATKVKDVVDKSDQTLTLLKQQLISRMGLFAAARSILKRRS